MFGLNVIVPVQSADQSYWNWLSGAPLDPIIGPTYETQDLLDTQAVRGARERALANIADTTLARTVNRQAAGSGQPAAGSQAISSQAVSSQQSVVSSAIPWTPILIALAVIVMLRR